jgi:class 3 adenylate cyclase
MSMADPFHLFMPSFGESLKRFRQLRGLTVEQLAEAVHLAPSAIRTMESGGGAPPKETVKALADALHLDKSERDSLDLAATVSSPFLAGIFQQDDSQPSLPDLHASILVFLIADVRGYTPFTQQQGDDAAARLTMKFAEIARSTVERWDGRLVELRGDEALVVFGSVRQALQAALAMQARFAEETSADPELPLNVGIGLDVGEAVQLDEGYRGTALNRAARLCSLAAAGEILVTTGLVYVAPKVDGVAFSARGQAQLKGFETSADIMAVTRMALPASDAP